MQYSTVYASVATLIVSHLVKKYELDMNSYGILHGLFVQILTWGVSMALIVNFDIFYAKITGIIGLIAGICYVGFNMIFKQIQEETKYAVLRLHDTKAKKDFKEYITKNKGFWGICNEVSVGDFNEIIKSPFLVKDVIPILNEFNIRTYFNDPFLGVSGYYVYKLITTKLNEKDDEDNKENKTGNDISHTVIEVFFRIKDILIDPEKIFNKIMETINNNKLELRFTKCLLNKNVISTFYEGPKHDLETLEKIYMSSFFYQGKDQLWSLIKETIMNPLYYEEYGQVPRISLLLYGPPGTGKSTLTHRLAMCLSRNVISMDLRGETKSAIYSTLQDKYNVESSIFVFEEFDMSILELYQKEKIKLINNRKLDFDIISEEYDNNKEICDSDKSMIFTPTTNHKEFELRDLLELFQGTISFASTMIIATTNKYDQIKQACPELLRPGRLTPVYFGYVDIDTLQDICKFYFNRKIKKRLPSIIEIPTSQIIDIALKFKNKENGFDLFEEELLALL